MKLLGRRLIKEAQAKHADSRSALASWVAEVDKATWSTPQSVRNRYRSADFVGDRVVFDIRGNKYRLIAKVDYTNGIIQVRWVGTHAEYDKIRVEEV